MLNTIANYVKVAGILATDLVNKVYDPFQEFTRPAEPVAGDYLVQGFELQMREKFLDPETGLWQYELPWNSGDQCIWHGVYTAMWAIKASIPGMPYDTTLRDSVTAMHHFFEFPDIIRRGVVNGVPQYDVSNDQISGLLCGLYFAYTYGDLSVKTKAKPLIKQLGDCLIRNNFKLINPNGLPTKHGKLINGLLTDPLNLCIALAIMKLCMVIYPEREYGLYYHTLIDDYKPMIPYGKVKLLWRENTYDTHRAAISYSILCDLEKSPKLHGLYEKGIRRVWDIARKTGNPWIYYLLRRVSSYRPEDIEVCKKVLTEFDLTYKIMRQERVNSDKVEWFTWGGRKRARQPLPRYKAGTQDFFWQRHAYSVDDWVGSNEVKEAYNGADYLIAYYGLKQLRLI